jgi:enoyl-CoA hydratase/carnithine racemase
VPVTLTSDESVATVRMQWPEVRNALDASRARELREKIQAAVELDGCRAIIIAGSGKAFCSGGDLRFFAEQSRGPAERLQELISSVYQPLIKAILNSPVPVLAAVDGAAIGLGMDLALACDSCFVGPDGGLMQGWAKVGLIPGAGGLLFLRRTLSPHEVWRQVVEQPRIDAAQAAVLGIAVDASDVGAERAALTWARKLTALPGQTIVGYRRLLAQLSAAADEHLRLASALQASLLTSAEFGEIARSRLGDAGSRKPGST